MYEEELQAIKDASDNNALTFFVGAGVSALSKAPNWKELINAFCEKIGRPPKIDENDDFSSDEYLRIPQMYFYAINKNNDEYIQFVKEQLHLSKLFLLLLPLLGII